SETWASSAGSRPKPSSRSPTPRRARPARSSKTTAPPWTRSSRSSPPRRCSEMAKVWVYVELNQGRPASTVLELMAKARELGDVTAIALGTGAKAAAATLGAHGAKVVYVNEDKAFDDFVAEPATDALAELHKQDAPDVVLFGFTPDSREVAGRLAARLDVGLISNAADVSAKDGGFVAKVPYFGGAKFASMFANKKPAIILIRPKSFEASEKGGTAE